MENLNIQKKLGDESGFALLVTIVLLVLLTVVFVVVLNSNRLEILISGNDRLASQAEFAAMACASIEGRKIRGLKVDSLTIDSPNNVECNTDVPQITFFSGAIQGFQTGIPNGYQLSQFNFNSLGQAPRNSEVNLQSLAQALYKGQ